MTLRDRYCRAIRASEEHYDEWMDWRDWHSIELNSDEIRDCEQEAWEQGITIADCYVKVWIWDEPTAS